MLSFFPVDPFLLLFFEFDEDEEPPLLPLFFFLLDGELAWPFELEEEEEDVLAFFLAGCSLAVGAGRELVLDDFDVELFGFVMAELRNKALPHGAPQVAGTAPPNVAAALGKPRSGGQLKMSASIGVCCHRIP